MHKGQTHTYLHKPDKNTSARTQPAPIRHGRLIGSLADARAKLDAYAQNQTRKSHMHKRTRTRQVRMAA